MAAEMEVVVREEKFLKEEPDRLETALRRCKKLTGTLVTLKRLASVQEQRHTGALPGNPEKSSEGNLSDGELHNVKTTISSDPHTVIHVPPGGRTENALDALLDELQTFTKPLETPRDNIPGLLGPQKRLPSYPSSESPVRSPVPGETAANSGQNNNNSAFRKLQVNDGEGQTVTASPKREVKTVKVDGVEATGTGNPPKKAPPPPPPRTTSRSPLTSPAEPGGNFGRSNSAPGGDTIVEARRETLSSNSSSSESVNSQEGAGTAPKARVDALEQRHQELLRKQKLLQDQYTRLQKLQNSTMLARFSPNDLKKTGSESNILSKSALTVTPSSGSLTHLAGSAATFDKQQQQQQQQQQPPDVVAKSAKPAPAVPAKPKTKIYETDIL